MEVHRHSHTARKKKTDFLWEFLMLFLAVFCGFLAENLREHIIEHKREKKYIRSIVKDLATDTAWMNTYLYDQRASIEALDSVIYLLKKAARDSNSRKRVYYLARKSIKLSSPNKINYNAYDQMRNSGNLRLIKEQATVDSISRYYFGAKDIEQLNETIMQRQSALVEFEGKIFDGTVFQNMLGVNDFEFKEPAGSPALVTADKNLINDFITRAHYLISANVFSQVYARRQKQSAINLINFLKKEYNQK
jgi:hypothetical protein